MCLKYKSRRDEPSNPAVVAPTPPSNPARSESAKSLNTPKEAECKQPIYITKPVQNETKPEQVQNRLVPVIKYLSDLEPLNKTGGSSDLFAEKLTQQNKLDEAKDLHEQTCQDDDNYYNLRKDILAIVDKSHTKKEEDTKYEKSKKKVKEQPKKPNMTYKKDTRQSKSREEQSKSSKSKSSNSLEKLPTEYDTEEANEKNYMYNLKEIDYCTHDMMRCIEEDNLHKVINDDSKLPDKVDPYGDLEQLTKRKYTSCKVLRRNTMISTLCSMPSADEAETAATATAKHMTDHCPIRFLPVTTLIAHCDEMMREDQTRADMSDHVMTGTGTAIALTAPAQTAVPIMLHDGGNSKKKSKREEKKKKKEGKKEDVLKTCDDSEKKTAEEM